MTECDQAQLLPTSSLFNYGAWQGDIRQFETLSTYHSMDKIYKYEQTKNHHQISKDMQYKL